MSEIVFPETDGAAAKTRPGHALNAGPSPSCGGTALTTGDMARLTGSTLRTVRFYEQEGLITPLDRKDGGHRQFDAGELEKLRLALDLREAGLGLAEIKHMFSLRHACSERSGASAAMTALLSERIGEVQEKILRLRRLREELTAMASSLTECSGCLQGTCEGCDVLESDAAPRGLRVLLQD